jgi:hypothetical protein
LSGAQGFGLVLGGCITVRKAFFFLLPLLFALVGRAGEPSPSKATALEFTGSLAYHDLRRQGYQVVLEHELALAKGRRCDVAVVSRSALGLVVSAYRQGGKHGFDLASVSQVAQATDLVAFKEVSLGASKAFFLDAIEDNPDETEHYLRLFLVGRDGLKEVLSFSYSQAHTESEAGRRPVSTVDLGRLVQGFHFVDVPTTARSTWPNVLINHTPKWIEIRSSETPVRVILGLYQSEFREHGGRFVQVSNRFVEYLHPVSGHPSKESQPVFDGRLSTSYEGTEGSTVSMRWDRPTRILAVRIIPGCVADSPSWRSKGKLRTMILSLGSFKEIRIDRKAVDQTSPAVLGIGDFSLPGKPFGIQTLVFFKQPILATGIKLSFVEVEAGSEASRCSACLTELTPLRGL